MYLYHAMPKGEPPVEGGVAAERRHPVAGAGASVGQLISSIYVPHEYRRKIIGPLPEIPRWALSHIRTRPRPTVVKHTGESSRDPAASELPATEWFIKNGFRFGPAPITTATGVACRLWQHHWPNDNHYRHQRGAERRGGTTQSDGVRPRFRPVIDRVPGKPRHAKLLSD